MDDAKIRTEHRIHVKALWGDPSRNKVTKCKILDYGPVQGTRMIKLTADHDGYFRKGDKFCADLDDIWERNHG